MTKYVAPDYLYIWRNVSVPKTFLIFSTSRHDMTTIVFGCLENVYSAFIDTLKWDVILIFIKIYLN